MTAPVLTVNLKDDQERAIITYGTQAQQLLHSQFALRSSLQSIDRAYSREADWTEEQLTARFQNRNGDKKKFQNITVPIIMPQVEAAAGYMTEVFLTGDPIFGVSGDPSNIDAAMQMETIVAENAITAGWKRQLLMFFRDALKYNICALECEWRQKTVFSLVTDVATPEGSRAKSTLWNGNALKRMDFYNTFFDPRVPFAEIHEKGEYAGYNELYSRVMMKQLMNELFGKVNPLTAIRALKSNLQGGISSTAPFSYFVPQVNPEPLMDRRSFAQFDWLNWANASNTTPTINYSNAYILTKLYARLIPADFGLDVPEKNTPQVWKFLIVNGQVIIWAERQTNAHNYIPIFFGQPIEDGLNFQTKSFATNVSDMQDVASAMWNGYIASKRRLVTDRVLYDPLRVSEKDINNSNPAAKIPVRPVAYGKPVAEAVYQFPFRDEQTSSLLQGADLVVKFANIINGQNPAQQGQFVKGNKTRSEYEDVMGHGNNNNQKMAISLEAQVFTPLKETIKLNILQFQQSAVYTHPDNAAQVKIQPAVLRMAAVQFKVSDGLTPMSKLMSTDEFTMAVQAIGSSQAIGAGYNVAPMFSYLMKLKGVDLRPFEKSQEQVQYEQQLGAWQQAAAMAVQKGTPFSTPMPQPPATAAQKQQGQQQQQLGNNAQNSVGSPTPTLAAE